MKLEERVGWSQPEINQEEGYVANVKILGIKSKNGRTYRKKAMEQAQGLYEGKGVNLDHRSPGQRKVTEAYGRFRGITVKEDGLYAQRFEYIKSHPFTKQFLEIAQRMPEQLGFSHVAEGQVVRDGEEEFVESIEAVESADIVRYPASVKGLFEGIDEDPAMSGGDGARVHLRAAITALLDDRSLPTADVRSEIMAILRTEKRVAGEVAQESVKSPPAEEVKEAVAETPTEEVREEEASKADGDEEAVEKLQEEVKALTGKITVLEHARNLVECIQSYGLSVADMAEEQLEELRGKKTREEMDKFAEGLPPAVRSTAQRPVLPAGGSMGNYESLRKELEEELQFS